MHNNSSFHRRRRWYALASVLLAVLSVWSCSDDKTPLGSELLDDLLATRPPVLFVDTLDVTDDVSYAFNSLVINATELEVGRMAGYVRTMVMRPDFSKAGLDTGYTVSSARLSLKLLTGPAFTPVRFYRLGTMYSEGDSIAVLDTLDAIVDPSTGSVERTLQLSPGEHELPVDLVQSWIRGEEDNFGIAIVYWDPVNDRLASFGSTERVPEAGQSDQRPTLRVSFTGQGDTSYRMAADATMYRPTASTSNLIVSDGYVRRIYFDIDINQLDENASVHSAFVRFRVAPSNAFLGEQRVVLYVPDSRDPNTRGFRTGPLVWSITMDSTSTNLEFPLTATVLALLEGEVEAKGFVIRYANEPEELRYREFYSSSAAVDSLRPRVYVTSSTPAEFE